MSSFVIHLILKVVLTQRSFLVLCFLNLLHSLRSELSRPFKISACHTVKQMQIKMASYTGIVFYIISFIKKKKESNYLSLLTFFFLDEKETKSQAKNMRRAPHGILQISRSAALH